MSRERAVEIVSKCVAHVWVMQGLSEEPLPSLAEYSLAELVEANHIIGKSREMPGEKMMMNCDDRLVAALYVAYHYDGEVADDPDSMLTMRGIGKGNGVLVVRIKE